MPADNDFENWSRDYWLGHCEGFRVEGCAGKLGFVEQVLGEEGEPEELVVRGGVFGNRAFRVAVGSIQEIEPRAERILLRLDRERAR